MIVSVKEFIRENSSFFIIILVLSFVYFLTRIPNLTLQPIFADEAIYIRWAQVMKAEPTLRFLPLSDGKTPLFMWAMMPLFKVFQDPLFAGRILSVFSGFLTFLGVIFLGWKFFNKASAVLAGFLIVITPMILFFDRMALVDSMLSAFFIWSLIFSLLLVKYKRLDLSFILGYLLGGGILTKTPGMFSLMALPFSFFAFDFKSANRQWRFAKTSLLIVVSITTAMVMYNLLRLGPGFTSLSSRNQDYVFSPEILLSRPLDPFIPHFNDLVDWLPKMLTMPVLGLVIFSILLSLIQKNKSALAILAWAGIPLLIEMAFLKTFTARYILFSFPPLLVLSGWVLNEILHKIKIGNLIKIFLVLSIFLPQALYLNFYLLFDPINAPLPKEEKRGYFEDWTAGYGFKEIAEYLKSQVVDEVVVGTEGSFGTLPDGLQIYLDKNTNIKFVPGNKAFPESLRKTALDHKTFFVANSSRYSGIEEGFELIKDYPKAKGFADPPLSVLLLKVHPEDEKN